MSCSNCGNINQALSYTSDQCNCSVPGIPVAIGEKGETGNTGSTGATGATGATGPSAYAIAVDNGFVGTEEEWLESLRGTNGTDGADADINTLISDEEALNTLKNNVFQIGMIIGTQLDPESSDYFDQSANTNPDAGIGKLYDDGNGTIIDMRGWRLCIGGNTGTLDLTPFTPFAYIVKYEYTL